MAMLLALAIGIPGKIYGFDSSRVFLGVGSGEGKPAKIARQIVIKL